MASIIKPRTLFGALALTIIASVIASGCRFTGFSDPAARASAGAADAWLVAQQRPDGGFELAGFPGFETSDAILAVAEGAQTESTWSTAQARAAVANVVRAGKTPLDAIDDFADGAITTGQAAKLIVLVAKPLGFAPQAFNPQGDGTTRNLVSVMNAGALPNGSYGTGVMNATLYAAIAQRLVTGAVPANTLAFIRSTQEASGGWDFAGNPTGADADVDTTALAVQALVSAGVPGSDVDLRAALAFLATQYRTTGAWPSFGTDDPNSTATATLAVTAAGYDVNASCWRNQAVPGLSGQPYTSPITWLRTQQATDGHVASPNDTFGLNTFATSQSVQALRRGWLPVNAVLPQTCP